MTLLLGWVQSSTANALGWALVHSLWEGALVALALAVLLRAARPARVRYGVACLALLSLVAVALSTFAYLLPRSEAHAIAANAVRSGGSGVDLDLPRGAAEGSAKPSLAEYLPWLAPVWVAGVLIFQLRLLASCLFAQRLRHRGVCCPSDRWQQRLDALGASLRITRPVRLLESCLAEVPVVIGHIRPLILIPVGLLANLPVQQVESILLHELAHIRRYDYLVNLFQIAVEGLLFYHPALWWISGVIRGERENCCDDLVVAISGNPHEYATALAALEENRGALREAVLAATGGHLVKRIRRLLGQPERGGHLAPVFSAGVLTVAAAMALAAWQVKPTLPPAVPSAYELWLNQDVVYIIKDEERVRFERLRTDAERQQFIEQFWKQRDPTPATVENEFKEAHYRRIAYANERYGAGALPGWKSDRGKTYITWGPPDEIESHPSGEKYERPVEQGGGTTSTFPFEKWRYRSMPGVGDDVFLDFVDRNRSGEYPMTPDPSGGRFLYTAKLFRPYVLVGPERRASAGIPLDFEAKQYSIALSVRTGDGRIWWKSAFVVSSCAYSRVEPACLTRPDFETETTPLEPGSYVMDTVVTDGPGLTTRKYAVSFTVN